MNIEELEAELESIDRQAASNEIKVNVEGAIESSGSLSISIEEQYRPRPEPRAPQAPRGGSVGSLAAESDYAGGESMPTRERTLLDVDLNDVHVPDEYIDEKIRAAISRQDNYGELPGVKLSQIGSSDSYQVEEDYTYVTRFVDDTDHALTALKGFKYDRASIPRIFWVIIDKDSLSNTPPLFHDLLYRNGGVLSKREVSPYRTFVRDEADDLFFELMRKSGVANWRSQLAYLAVKRFSKGSWRTKIF